jgi:hypothetical protein
LAKDSYLGQLGGKDQRVYWENQVSKEYPVLWVNQVHLGQKARWEFLGLQDKRAQLVKSENLDHKDKKGKVLLTDHRDKRVNKEIKDQKEVWDPKVKWVKKVQLDLQVQSVQQVLLVNPEPQAQ